MFLPFMELILSMFVAEGSRTGYGSGGFLTVDKRDPTRFRVFIEGDPREGFGFKMHMYSGNIVLTGGTWS